MFPWADAWCSCPGLLWGARGWLSLRTRLLRTCLSCPIVPPGAPGGHGGEALHWVDTPSETDHRDEAPETMQVQGEVGHPHWATPGALLRTGPCKPHPSWGPCLPRLMGAALMGVAPRLCGQNSLPPASASPPCGTDLQAPAVLWPLGPLKPERCEALSID